MNDNRFALLNCALAENLPALLTHFQIRSSNKNGKYIGPGYCHNAVDGRELLIQPTTIYNRPLYKCFAHNSTCNENGSSIVALVRILLQRRDKRRYTVDQTIEYVKDNGLAPMFELIEEDYKPTKPNTTELDPLPF